MEASLTCAVCLGVFQEPVTLPLCSHNFCKRCVTEFASKQASTLLFHNRDSHCSAGTVSCPLCRKVSSLPGGIADLRVNTTLAEVVKLLSLTGGCREEEQAASCTDAVSSSNSRAMGYCPDHSEHKLELFCKNCAQACCGKCVSTKHQGMFHNVNLLDMTYQEEKLMFFNSLKRLREVHETLTKEIPDDENEIEEAMQRNTTEVILAFDEAQKALDLKKQQLLELIKAQQSRAKKRSEVRKVTRSHHKNTVGSLIKDCEDIVDEHEPQKFLQVACGLNKRMKSNLDIIDLRADLSEGLKSEFNCVDLQALLKAISALKLTTSKQDGQKISNEFLANVNGNFSFRATTRTWKPNEATTKMYCPVVDRELISIQGQLLKLAIRYVSIAEMPEYRHLSHEELRLKHYKDYVIQMEDVTVPERKIGPVECSPSPFRTARKSRLKATIRRQNGFDGQCASIESNCKPATFPKIEFRPVPGKLPQSDHLSTCGLESQSEDAEVQGSPGLLHEGTCGLSTDINVGTTNLCNKTNKKNVYVRFCLETCEVTTFTKHDKSGRSHKKPKTTVPSTMKTGLFTGNLTAQPITMFGNHMCSSDSNFTFPFSSPPDLELPIMQRNKVPEDSSSHSASSEEFYDAKSNVNSDVEESSEETSRLIGAEGESERFQQMPD